MLQMYSGYSVDLGDFEHASLYDHMAVVMARNNFVNRPPAGNSNGATNTADPVTSSLKQLNIKQVPQGGEYFSLIVYELFKYNFKSFLELYIRYNPS